MGNFKYRAITAAGEKVKGTLAALDEKDAVAMINATGNTIIELAEDSPRAFNGMLNVFSERRIRSDELLIFYSQMYDMIGAGITFLVSLEAIAEQTRNKKLKNAIHDIDESIKRGISISEAFERHKDIFPDLFVNMIRSGEASGKLDVVLGNYIDLYEAQLDLRQKVAGALFYPFILLCMGVGIVLFLVIFIIPKFAAIFTNAGVPLPLLTKSLYLTGTAIIRYWYFMIIGAVLGGVGVRQYIKTKSGRFRLDTLKLLFPVIGELNRNVALSRFLTTLGLLLHSGVSIIKSLELSGPVMRNVVMEAAISDMPGRMEKGESFSSLLKADKQIPSNVVQMIATGEETGNLVGMLERTSVFYDKAIQRTIKKLTIVIEPVFLVIIGSVVGLIMASIMIPLFKMIDIAKM